MRVGHFYHCFAAGRGWTEAVEDHNFALERGGWDERVRVGLIGDDRQRNSALALIRRSQMVAEATNGWEQMTLQKVWESAQLDEYDAIMYAHSKGAANPTPWHRAWRRSMQYQVVFKWRSNLDILGGGYDAIGCHWISHADFPHLAARGYHDGFFGGNYWIATTEYLRELPPPQMKDRFDAERWINTGEVAPRVYDLLEGWPSEETFQRGGVLP